MAADEIAAIGMLNQLPHIGEWRHLALAGTGMAASVSGFPRNEITPLTVATRQLSNQAAA